MSIPRSNESVIIRMHRPGLLLPLGSKEMVTLEDALTMHLCKRCGWPTATPAKGGICHQCKSEEKSYLQIYNKEWRKRALKLMALHAYQRTDSAVHLFTRHWLSGIEGIQRDSYDNWWVEIGSGSATVFTCHTDTVGSDGFRSILAIDEKTTDLSADGILGSDDSAGVYIMLRMIERGVPGLYVFHSEEESGCRGSSAFVAERSSLLSERKRCVSFDRRGQTSVITHMGSIRTASDAFASALANEINIGTGFKFKPDSTGSLTDAKMYRRVVPECTNISVGYESAHTNKEFVDTAFILQLAERLCDVKWEELPTERDPKEVDHTTTYFQSRSSYRLNDRGYYDWEEEFFGGSTRRTYRRKQQFTPLKVTDFDDQFIYEHGDLLFALGDAHNKGELEAIVAMEVAEVAYLLNDLLGLELYDEPEQKTFLEPSRAEVEKAIEADQDGDFKTGDYVVTWRELVPARALPSFTAVSCGAVKSGEVYTVDDVDGNGFCLLKRTSDDAWVGWVAYEWLDVVASIDEWPPLTQEQYLPKATLEKLEGDDDDVVVPYVG
ncbi:MAG: hypothetical protein E6R03_11330 [Hyphomicrobiaceae bacterium]|nr:MAG: hypothetical protein E6R03_11330 [Hyphomicrobiaceae bacterium]